MNRQTPTDSGLVFKQGNIERKREAVYPLDGPVHTSWTDRGLATPKQTTTIKYKRAVGRGKGS